MEHSLRNSAHKRWKQTKPQEHEEYQTTGDEKTSTQRVMPVIKSLTKTTKWQGSLHTYQY
jgi:hypothetical protein